MSWLGVGLAFLGAAVGAGLAVLLFLKKGVSPLIAWLLKNAVAPLGQLIAGLLGQQLAAMNIGAAQAGSILARACTVAQGGTVSFSDANDQDIVQGVSGMIPPLVSQFGLQLADVIPVLQAAATRLSSRTPPPAA